MVLVIYHLRQTVTRIKINYLVKMIFYDVYAAPIHRLKSLFCLIL